MRLFFVTAAIHLLLPPVLVLAQDSGARLPVPSEEAQKEARELLREVFGEECAQARGPKQQSALAKKLLAKNDEPQDDPASHYVLLQAARTMAIKAGDTTTAFQAIDKMFKMFKIDDLAMKAGAVPRLVELARSTTQEEVLAKNVRSLITEAIKGDKFAIADQLVADTWSAARKANNRTLKKSLPGHKKEIQKAKKDYAAVQEALTIMQGKPGTQEKPGDPKSNRVAGEYFCFTKGEWEKGVPMLALGDDAALEALALDEMKKAGQPGVHLRLGDGWWDLAETKDGNAKRAIRSRVAYWYRKALPNLIGLRKEKIENRLKEIAAADEKDVPKPRRRPAAQIDNGIMFRDPLDCAAQAHQGKLGPKFNPSTSWRLTFEFKAPNFRPGRHLIFYWGEAQPGADVLYFRQEAKKLHLVWADVPAEKAQKLHATLGQEDANRWIKIQVDFDSELKTMELRLDDKPADKTALKVVPRAARAMPIWIGGENAHAQRFKGQVRNLWFGNLEWLAR